MQENLTSLQSHILNEEEKHPDASGDFSWILSSLSLATKAISAKVRAARVDDVLGDTKYGNVHGEKQQKLDLIANEILIECLGTRHNIGILASEENEEPAILRSSKEGGRYAILFDPLDGSSNLDFSVGVGTIFSIVRLEQGYRKNPEKSILQLGTNQAAAGYVIYGSSTVFVLTTGNGVDMFVLDANLGTYVLVQQNVKIPTGTKQYSINEAYKNRFPKHINDYLEWAQNNNYSSRYIGSMVADVHRILLKGGVFLYPPTSDRPDGKLRLMYEGNPMAFVIEQAGGKAMSGSKRLLDEKPSGLHQRTDVLLGSSDQVDRVLSFMK